MKQLHERQVIVAWLIVIALCCFAMTIILNTGERPDYVLTIQTGETKHVPVLISGDGAWMNGDVMISWRENE